MISGFPAGTVIHPHTPQKHLTHFQISKPRSIYDRLLDRKWLGLHQRIRLFFFKQTLKSFNPPPQKKKKHELLKVHPPNTTNLPKWKLINF